MPTAPMQRCSYTDAAGKCTTLTAGGRCPQHRPQPWTARSKHWGRGSTRQWRAFRAEHLRLEPNCRACAHQGRTTPATQVDHITPLAQHGSKYDHANAQSLCDPHHDLKTRAETAARNRVRRRPT